MGKRKRKVIDIDWDYKYFMVKVRGMFTNKDKKQFTHDLNLYNEDKAAENFYHERMYGIPYHKN